MFALDQKYERVGTQELRCHQGFVQGSSNEENWIGLCYFVYA
jgi:hypothetical protein